MAKKKESAYQVTVEELESIVQKLERNEIPIDELADEVKKAKALVDKCKKKLRGIAEDIDINLS